MALDVYVKEDVLNALKAIKTAYEGSSDVAFEIMALGRDLRRGEQVLVEGVSSSLDGFEEKVLSFHRRGFHQAVKSVALSFGIESSPIGKESAQIVDSRMIVSNNNEGDYALFIPEKK